MHIVPIYEDLLVLLDIASFRVIFGFPDVSIEKVEMKHPLLKGSIVVAISLGLVVPATTAASAQTFPSPSIPSAPAASTGVELVGTGYTDLSSLHIVGTINPVTGQITSTPTPTPTPAAKPSPLVVTPQIHQPACNGRIDYYRIIDDSGYTRCFASSGVYMLSSSYWSNIQTLCPGNNRGRTEYVNGSTNTWSVWRDPTGDYTSCYSFAYPVPAFAVQIQ